MEFRCEYSPKQVMVWVEKDTKAKEVNRSFTLFRLPHKYLDSSWKIEIISQTCTRTVKVTHLPVPKIKKISCGPNHTVAVDENNKVGGSS